MKPSFLSAMKPLVVSAVAVAALACSAAAPKPLLDFAGARWEPARLADAVLVIVDAQREYTDGKLRLPDVDAAVGEIAGPTSVTLTRIGTAAELKISIVPVPADRIAVSRRRASRLPDWPAVDTTAVNCGTAV